MLEGSWFFFKGEDFYVKNFNYYVGKGWLDSSLKITGNEGE